MIEVKHDFLRGIFLHFWFQNQHTELTFMNHSLIQILLKTSGVTNSFLRRLLDFKRYFRQRKRISNQFEIFSTKIADWKPGFHCRLQPSAGISIPPKIRASLAHKYFWETLLSKQKLLSSSHCWIESLLDRKKSRKMCHVTELKGEVYFW